MDYEKTADKLIQKWKDEGWEFIFTTNPDIRLPPDHPPLTPHWHAGRSVSSFPNSNIIYLTDPSAKDKIIEVLKSDPRRYHDNLRHPLLARFKLWSDMTWMIKLTGYKPWMSVNKPSKIHYIWCLIWKWL